MKFQFKNFGKTSTYLLRENGWFGFLNPELSSTEQTETLSRLLSEDDEIRTLAESKTANPEEAYKFQTQAHRWANILERIKAHTSRTTQENLREYIRVVEHVAIRYFQSPNYGDSQILKEHCPNLGRILKELHEGEHDDHFTGSLLVRLENQIQEMSLVESCCYHDAEECEKAHKKFVSAFQKAFKISVERWETLGVGVALYLDQESHDELQDQIKEGYRALDNFAEENEYILIRRGLQTDIDFGEAGSPASRWMFTYSPKVDEEKDLSGLEIVSKHDYAPIPLKQT